MNPHSLRFRLTAWYAAILTLTLAATGFGVWLALRQSIRKTVDTDLRSRLRPMREYIDQQGSGPDERHLRHELEEQAAVMPAGVNVRLASTNGTWVYRSPGTEAWNLAVPRTEELPAGGEGATILVHGEPIRVLSAPVSIGVLQIGVPVEEFEEMLRLFTWTMLLGSPLLLALASAGGYWMSARALRPVDELATSARRISARNLSERLPSLATGDELDRLAATLNGMLARLEAAFGRITRFTADASHELRTPVAIMRTTAEVTRSKKRSDEEHARAWDVIITQTSRTAELIEDLLMLARTDSGSEEIVMEAMDLAALLRETSAEMQVIAESAGLRLNTHVPPECPAIGDPEAIRRILLVLLDNAIKYTRPEGTINVEMVLHARAPEDITIIVEDTGIGISPEDLPHVFDRFYRAAKDRSRKTGGAGLGLTIAQHLAARCGGEILVKSILGVGSTFFLRLPAFRQMPRHETACASGLLQNPPS